MMFWILSALLTAIVAIALATPHMRNKQVKTGWLVALVCGLLPLALYLLLGRPELLN